MKRAGLLLLSFYIGCAGFAQKIQYSRQVVSTPRVDAMQLVTNVAGNHHLLTFRLGKNPKVFVFNKQLQLTAETEIEAKLKDNHDIRIIPFREYYFLQLSGSGTSNKKLLKVSADGETEDITERFLKVIDSAGINRQATIQLVNQNNSLCLVSMIYADAVKAVYAKILELNADLNIIEMKEVSFPFHLGKENLQQTTLTQGHFVVLKTIRDDESRHVLELSKINLTTGEVLFNTFTTATHLYSNPAFRYAEKDSSVFLYSLIREQPNSGRQDRSVLVAKLNDSLQEITPLNLLKSQFRNNARFNFLTVESEQPFWITLGNGFVNRVVSINSTPNLGSAYLANRSITNGFYMGGGPQASQLPSLRLTVLNEQLRPSSDSLVESKDLFYDLQPSPIGQCTINRTAYLVLIQNFTANKRGLVMVNADDNGMLKTTPLPVYDRYDYNPSLLQAGNDYFILPYSHKNETGLLKITLQD